MGEEGRRGEERRGEERRGEEKGGEERGEEGRRGEGTMTNTFKISSCSDPPSAFLSFQMYVLSWSRSSVVCPGPSGSCDALTVAFGTGMRTITLVPELGGREEGEKEGR